jgi:hypothetical protein
VRKKVTKKPAPQNRLALLLDELLEAHPNAGFRSGALLRPGVRRAALERGLGSTGFPVHPTLEALFTWRDGTSRAKPRGLQEIMLLTPYHLPTLRECLKTRESFLQRQEAHGESFWRPEWFPFAADGMGDHLFVDLASGSPAVRLSGEAAEGEPTIADSLEDFVAFQLQCIRDGVIVADSDAGADWDIDAYFSAGAARFRRKSYWAKMAG